MDNDKTVSPEEEERTKSTITYMANEEIIKSTRGSIQLAHDKYMKPETYTGNRTLYDSDKAKTNAKKDIFEQNQRVIDPYTGERLVLTKKEAKMLYGEDWSKHLAESDHIKPLEKIYSDTKSNVWNTTGDIRTAANSKDNISVTSQKFNNPKRSRTQQEYLYDEKYLQNKGVNLTEDGKKRALMDAEQAEKSINSQLKKKTVENICKTGHEAGMNSGKAAGETAVIISGLMNIADVVNGEKEVDEAVYDVLKTGGESAVVGYAMGSTMTILGHSLEDSSSDIIQALLGSNVPTKIITAVQVMGGTIKKFATGDIELNECIEELGKDGVNFAAVGYASVIGQELIPIPVVGAAIGAFVGTVITGKCYELLLNDLNKRELEHQERLRIIEESKEIAEKAKNYRKRLDDYLEQYLEEYKKSFENALLDMKISFQIGDVDGMIDGANQITKKLGGIVKYENIDEFKGMLKSKQIDVL